MFLKQSFLLYILNCQSPFTLISQLCNTLSITYDLFGSSVKDSSFDRNHSDQTFEPKSSHQNLSNYFMPYAHHCQFMYL